MCENATQRTHEACLSVNRPVSQVSASGGVQQQQQQQAGTPVSHCALPVFSMAVSLTATQALCASSRVSCPASRRASAGSAACVRPLCAASCARPALLLRRAAPAAPLPARLCDAGRRRGSATTRRGARAEAADTTFTPSKARASSLPPSQRPCAGDAMPLLSRPVQPSQPTRSGYLSPPCTLSPSRDAYSHTHALIQERPGAAWRVLAVLPYLVPLMGSLAFGQEM